MRILMFGRGVIATIYGQVLQEGGHQVEYLVRPGRAAEYGDEVRTDVMDARRSPLGRRVRTSVATRLRESLGPADGFDLVVLSVGHLRLEEAAAYLAPRIGEATVLVFGNVWDEPLAAVAPLPADQVVFGFPQGGGGFGPDGVLHGALFRSIVLDASGRATGRRGQLVRAAFRRAGLGTREEEDMRGWLLLHFAMDAGMFSQALAAGGLARMVGDPRALREAFLASRELLPVLEARDVDLSRHSGAALPWRLPGLTAGMLAAATVLVPIARVSLAAHTDPDAVEHRAVLEDALRAARELGISTPRLARAAR
ncbi:2-dehydropantoate 2-reductase [Clavibacter sp. B3I6]|uniref:ketopantoate reductase family protein n=1 Tax=Clavibacter sp. B3I6 TaxID=3042268 RepID=UPI0027875A5A|nr:2-dehydropantoate 2-reductase N-terminal domain-containing protein [Clavibacter sp. B3I6]MDQ0745036.1 2-dehydropantoate 2-reductase [Clavibacter sp. B3I6]